MSRVKASLLRLQSNRSDCVPIAIATVQLTSVWIEDMSQKVRPQLIYTRIRVLMQRCMMERTADLFIVATGVTPIVNVVTVVVVVRVGVIIASLMVSIDITSRVEL